MRKKDVMGIVGERLVANYLKSKGYIIVSRNFKTYMGEIDIVAENPKRVLFVEVKTREKDSLMPPEKIVDRDKQYRIAMTARSFLIRACLFGEYRFDIAEVEYQKDENGRYHFFLNYHKNTFRVHLGKI